MSETVHKPANIRLGVLHVTPESPALIPADVPTKDIFGRDIRLRQLTGDEETMSASVVELTTKPCT